MAKYVVSVSGKTALEWVQHNTNGRQISRVGGYFLSDEHVWCKVQFATAAEMALYCMAFPDAVVYENG